MRNYFLIILIALSMPYNSLLIGQNCEQIFDQGVEAYLEKKYQLSSKKFEIIKDSCGTSKSLLFNLGNAYLKQDQYGLAILNYEKAIKYFKADSDLLHNLQIAKNKIKNPIHSPVVSIKKLYRIFSLDTWAYLTLSACLLTCVLFFIFYLNPQKKLLLYSVFFFFIMATTSFTLGFLHKNDLHKSYAIITTEKVLLKSNPEKNAPTILQLGEGTKIRTLNTTNEWTLVELPNLKKGWVRSNVFKFI